jgi:hypothetical protein
MTEKGRIIWNVMMRKSPLAPLCQSGECLILRAGWRGAEEEKEI